MRRRPFFGRAGPAVTRHSRCSRPPSLCFTRFRDELTTVRSRERHWTPHRIVVLEFPTMAALQRFYEAHDMADLKERRWAVSRSKMIAVEGI